MGEALLLGDSEIGFDISIPLSPLVTDLIESPVPILVEPFFK